jgi:hypothetical protein
LELPTSLNEIVWLLRVVKPGRWDVIQEDWLAKASEDLMLRDGEEGLSVFKIDNIEEAEEIFALYVFTNRDPGSSGYVLIDDPILHELGLRYQHVPVTTQLELLSEKHYEILDLTVEKSRELAARIGAALEASEAQFKKLTERELKDLGIGCLEKYGELEEKIKPKWRSEIQKRKRQLQ